MMILSTQQMRALRQIHTVSRKWWIGNGGCRCRTIVSLRKHGLIEWWVDRFRITPKGREAMTQTTKLADRAGARA